MTLSQELSIKGDCKIYGGTVKAAEGVVLLDGLIRIGYHSAPAICNLTMEDATVIAKDATVHTGIFYLDKGCSVTLDSVDVDVTGTTEGSVVGIFYYGNIGVEGDVTLKNDTTIKTEKVNAVFYRTNIDVTDSVIECENNYRPVFRGAEGTLSNTEVTVSGNLGNDETDVHPLIEALDSTSISFANGTTIKVDEATPIVAENSTINVYADSTVTMPESDAVIATVATLNGVPYTSLEEAAAAAKSGDVIVIYKNLQDLAAVVNGGNTLSGITVKLGADFDLAGIEWTPIGTNDNSFKGRFDGQNHTISNLTIDSEVEYAGLFGYVNGNGMNDNDAADISNVTLKNVDITNLPASGGRTGAVVGNAYTTYIDNVHVTGTINGAKWTGGIVGNTYTLIKNSSFVGNITANNQAGGIAGAGDVRAYDCYVKGDITAEYWAGGIVGNGQEGTQIVNCYAEGTITANSCWYFGVGGIAGVAGHGYEAGKIENNYFNGEVYLAGEKIDTPVIGFINADTNDDIKSMVGGNSWNTEYYPADLEVIVTAEVPSEGKAEDYATVAKPAEIQERNNNLVMLESDLEYVDAVNMEDVIIMDFSDVTEDAVEDTVDANVVAVVDGERFASFDEAYEAAEDNDVIDLVEGTIVLNNKTINKSVKIVNGTISMNTAASTFAVRALPVTGWVVNAPITFENVALVGDGFNTGSGSIFYLATAGANIKFINSTIDIKNDNANGGFIKADIAGLVAEFENTDAYIENTGRVFTNMELVKLSKDSDFVIRSTVAGGIENAFNRSGLEINDTSSVDIDGCLEYGIKMDKNVVLNGEAVLYVRNSGISDIMVRDDAPTGNDAPALKVAPDAKVYADFIESNVTTEGDKEDIISSVANVYVQFKEVERTEEAIKYDVIIAGNGKTINRLTTADLTFSFTSDNAKNSDMEYVVTPKAGVTLTAKGENRYMFNFDGITNPDETGKTVTIGQIEVSGFGSFTLKVDDTAADTNLVNATEVEDNIVDHFVQGGAENKGTLVINEDMDTTDDMVGIVNGEDAEITIPVRTLTINVAFPNKVDYNDADYQDMTITIVGGDISKEYALSDAAEAIVDESAKAASAPVAGVAGGYVIRTDLSYNTTYMVTVAGAGYRTARYSVVMTEDKVLNFWNNVKSEHNAMEIEEGVSGLTTKNFLAGDIVKDNTINIWDLNAVVSFFGTNDIKAMDAEDADRYVRYDLNRDGRIDSKDVAYVLVSWGN